MKAQEQSWRERIAFLCNVHFVRQNGALIAVYKGVQMPSQLPASFDEIACFENTINHVHFDFVPGKTAHEHWYANYVCAEVVCQCWKARLHVQLPEELLSIAVINELVHNVTEDGHFLGDSIIPTLRVWSSEYDYGGELARLYDIGNCDVGTAICVEHNRRIELEAFFIENPRLTRPSCTDE